MLVSQRENKTKKGCVNSLKSELQRLRADPNNYPYDFSIKSSESKKIIDGKYNVKIRRQKTSQGSDDPVNFCDDKGIPLTNEDGSPQWGGWHDCKEKLIGDKRRGNCYGNTMCYGGSFSSKRDALSKIDNLLRKEKKNQKNRKNKIQIDYKIEEIQPPSSEDIWKCKIIKEKVRDFPSTWDDINIKPESDYGMGISFRRHKISEKTGKQLSQTTGVGNFRNKKYITKELKNNEIFGMYRLNEELSKHGFKLSGSGYYSSNPYYAPIPDSEDVCTVRTSRRDFPFVASNYVISKLRSSEGKIPLGGYFEHATFGVGKKTDNIFDPIIEYKEKAPKKSITYCQNIANKVAENSLIHYVNIF